MRRIRPFLLSGLLAACGGGDPKPAPEAPPAVAEPAATAPPAEPAPDPKAELKARAEALREEIAAADEELSKLWDRHAEELKALGDKRLLERRFIEARRDARIESTNLALLEEEVAELKEQVGDSLPAELDALQKKRVAIEAEMDEAISVRKEAARESELGKVEQSPVKEDLDELRRLQRKWLELTAEARGKKLAAGAARAVSDAFRGWIREQERRAALVKQALALPVAPKGKTVDGYDFTDLDFYILCQILEDELDRKNIEVELRELAEMREKLDALQKKLDEVDVEIDALAEKGGGEVLLEYDAKRKQLADQRAKVEFLAEIALARQQDYAPFLEAENRHDEEEAALVARIDAAKAELAKIAAELR